MFRRLFGNLRKFNSLPKSKHNSPLSEDFWFGFVTGIAGYSAFSSIGELVKDSYLSKRT